jgi:hypothetical protein
LLLLRDYLIGPQASKPSLHQQDLVLHHDEKV